MVSITVSVMSELVFEKRRPCKPVCLFGRPDPKELEKLYQEACIQDSESFWKRFTMELDQSTLQSLCRPNVFLREDMEEEAQSGMTKREKSSQRRDRTALTGPPLSQSASLPGKDVPEGRSRDSDSAEQERRTEPVRYSPYQLQRKLTDIWRTTKLPSQARHKASHPQSIKTEEDLRNIYVYTSSRTRSGPVWVKPK